MLISVSQLAEKLEQSVDIVVFDCRFTLTKPAEGREKYLASHIPGAFYLDLDFDLSGPKGPGTGRHPLPDPAEFAAKLGVAGVGEGTTVVVYDAGEGLAPRAWWLVRYVGHPDVRVLDGGWQAWLHAGHEVTAELPTPRFRDFPLSVQDDWLVSERDVESIAEGKLDAILIDARAPERYRGDLEPLDAKAGHIPGAVNVPWMSGLDKDGFWLQESAQAERFAGLLESGRQLVAYCGSGVTACGNLFAMHLAGVNNAKLYPGSWSQWSSKSEHEVETGDGPGTVPVG